MNKREIRVLICGAAGRMGRVLAGTILRQPDMQLVAAVDIDYVGADIGVLAEMPPCGLLVSGSLPEVIENGRPDVMVDFTKADSAFNNLKTALNSGVACIVGTTGIATEKLEELGKLALIRNTGIFFAPNFSLGAVMMMEFTRRAAALFSWAEIIELHHEKKLDAPSGTAYRTAQIMREARGKDFDNIMPESQRIENTRGGETGGIHIHAVRMPGLLAHQEVIFGGEGETLTVRHDTIDRSCFMPGILMAIKAVRKSRGLNIGLEKILFGSIEHEAVEL